VPSGTQAWGQQLTACQEELPKEGRQNHQNLLLLLLPVETLGLPS
jgi:hypothetical protein